MLKDESTENRKRFSFPHNININSYTPIRKLPSVIHPAEPKVSDFCLQIYCKTQLKVETKNSSMAKKLPIYLNLKFYPGKNQRSIGTRDVSKKASIIIII